MVKRNDSRVRDALGITSCFIIEEEEQRVFQDWATNAAAELVSGQLRSFCPIPIVEKTIRCGRRGTIVLAYVSVKLIATALGYQFNLATAAAAFRCAGIG